MNNMFQTMTLMGSVTAAEPKAYRFRLTLLNGEDLSVRVSPTTYYEVLRNVGDEWRDRVPEPSADDIQSKLGEGGNDPRQRGILKYLTPGRMVVVVGIHTQNGDKRNFDARRVVLMHSRATDHGFEDTHWWLQQVNTLTEQWLDVLFDDTRDFTINDFAERYRTNLNILGGKTDDAGQECATMSRFLYGLSSSYLLTGNERPLSAARACAEYLVSAFAIVSHDRRYCFWKFGRRRSEASVRDIVPSQTLDDRNSYALYEQIYALSGLTQYYRITQDTKILSYIRMTIEAFQDFYHDRKRDNDPAFSGQGGYFSHIDTVSMRPDSPALVSGSYDNVLKKNWNSIGDHIPAYLINLLIAIDPLPEGKQDEWKKLRQLCWQILDECVENILDHFFTEDSPFVNERFTADWKQDLTWGWQQDRGIVGHNLKISWNLTRCGHYYLGRCRELRADRLDAEASKYDQLAGRCFAKASELAEKMDKLGVDQARGGIWDAVERKANEDGVHEFAWGNTKDFWQQEQAILAYYILHNSPGQTPPRAKRFLELARACTAFWNLFFIDQDNRKIFFRTDENGRPVIEGQYGIQGGHAIAGYHAFELNYLAHLYIRMYVSKRTDDNFSLVFRPVDNEAISSINVLPDFVPPGSVKIHSLRINGVDRQLFDADKFTVDLKGVPNNSKVEVEFRPIRAGADSGEDIDKRRPTSTKLSPL